MDLHFTIIGRRNILSIYKTDSDLKVERAHKGRNRCFQNLGIAKKQKKMDRHKQRTKKLPSRHDGPCSWDKATLQVHKCAQASLSPDPVNIVNLLFVNIWKYCKFVICNLIFSCYTFTILLSCPFSKEEMSDGRHSLKYFLAVKEL